MTSRFDVLQRRNLNFAAKKEKSTPVTSTYHRMPPRQRVMVATGPLIPSKILRRLRIGHRKRALISVS